MDGMRPVLAAPALALFLGCTTITPESFSAKAPPVAGHWPGSVSVTAVHRESSMSRFNANGSVFEVDLDQFSDELARLVRESLEQAGTSIAPGGKTLEVQVVYLDFMFQGPCLVDYTVQLGNGEIFGDQTVGDSANFNKGCRVAFESAVQRIVSDPRTRAYAGGP